MPRRPTDSKRRRDFPLQKAERPLRGKFRWYRGYSIALSRLARGVFCEVFYVHHSDGDRPEEHDRPGPDDPQDAAPGPERPGTDAGLVRRGPGTVPDLPLHPGRCGGPASRSVNAAFKEDGYVHRTQAGESWWPYRQIKTIVESRDHFAFLLDRTHGQIYDKHGFAWGDPDGFREFIQRKTGLKIQKV